jgi:hypothetical protein
MRSSLLWGLQPSPASFLLVISTVIRGKFPMNKMARLEWETQEYLFLCLHSLLGWPRVRNRWLYPDIFGWDENEEGDNVLPALIIFYPNPEVPIELERREAFHWHLERSSPGPWREHWHPLAGFIWAERTPYMQHTQDGPNSVRIRHLTSVEVQAVTSGYVTNGRPDDGREIRDSDNGTH